jgi:hypothetical protein
MPRALAEIETRSATWTSPSVTGVFALKADGATIARLFFEPTNALQALAECGPRRLSFTRVGLISPRVLVRSLDQQEDLGIYRQRPAGDGTLDLTDGSSLVWRPTNEGATSWAFFDDDGVVLVTFTPLSRGASRLVRHRVEWAHEDDDCLLATLGLFLLALRATAHR